MDCVRFKEVIQRYIDGELDRPEVVWFQRHLSFCPSCAADLDELGAVRGALAACAGVTAEVPAGFADRVCAAAASLAQPSFAERALSAATGGVLPGRVPRRARRIAYGAAVVLAAAIYWGRSHERKQREAKA